MVGICYVCCSSIFHNYLSIKITHLLKDQQFNNIRIRIKVTNTYFPFTIQRLHKQVMRVHFDHMHTSRQTPAYMLANLQTVCRSLIRYVLWVSLYARLHWLLLAISLSNGLCIGETATQCSYRCCVFRCLCFLVKSWSFAHETHECHTRFNARQYSWISRRAIGQYLLPNINHDDSRVPTSNVTKRIPSPSSQSSTSKF